MVMSQTFLMCNRPSVKGRGVNFGVINLFLEVTPVVAAAASALVSESSWGQGQFLKAPQRLARHMKSLSRLPSICQKAAVWVTSVR